MQLNITSVEMVYNANEEVEKVLIRYNSNFGNDSYINGAVDISKEEYNTDSTLETLKVLAGSKLQKEIQK